MIKNSSTSMILISLFDMLSKFIYLVPTKEFDTWYTLLSMFLFLKLSLHSVLIKHHEIERWRVESVKKKRWRVETLRAICVTFIDSISYLPLIPFPFESILLVKFMKTTLNISLHVLTFSIYEPWQLVSSSVLRT